MDVQHLAPQPTLRYLVAFLLGVALLAACAPAPTPTPTVTLTPTASHTPTSTLIPTATRTATNTPTATATVTPLPTATSTPEPTLLSTNTVVPAPTAKSTPAAFQAAPPTPVSGACLYIGNANSNKFHKPSCGSVKQMSAKNKVCLPSREAAIARGYSPCGNCKP